MRLLVTGGAGFMGSAFVRLFASEYTISVVDVLTYAGDLKRLAEVEGLYEFYRVDITNRESLRKVFEDFKPDAVIHFAAESHVDRSILNPEKFIETNIKGTYYLLDLAKQFKVSKFINVSTDEVYGELEEEGSFTENSPLRPNSPYSVSKAAADMLGRAYFRTYGLPVITVRPSNNYGPWQYPEKLIPVVIIKALKGEPVPVYGSGNNIREWIFVEDCVHAIRLVLDKGTPGEIYNISSGEEKRNIEVVKEILKLLGKGDDIIRFVKDRPGHDYRYSTDSTKIRKELGWKPCVSFMEGLKRTLEWYLSNLDWVEEKIRELENFWKKVYA
ncbi:MAG TPA: dTDP-glucose 4,6-dehydratase [Thermodesulfobacterium commune]|nr:MAG: dTDP-glucose 4,6-dehydratase [Thermodesulfobacterium commune]HCP09438.1 dTDP-glucose 4,6-dehydratase [Thermodesulfobacterium commune]